MTRAELDTTKKTDPGQSLMRTESVEKYFPVGTSLFDRLLGNERNVHAVDGVSLSIAENETVGLVGESGCGKSTLGLTLARLHDPTGGAIHFRGEDISGYSRKEMKDLRTEIQVIFQDPLSSLNPRKTIREILSKPLEVQNIASGQEKRDRVRELLQEVGLKEEQLDRYPHALSGGQQQRIGIARALSVEPSLIIADEPVSALDVSVQAQIINLMKDLQEEYGLSYLFIAHDLSVVKHVSDRVAVMYLGQIAERGPTEGIFNNPQHPYTRSLLNAIPSIEEGSTPRENILEGAPPSPIDPPSGCSFHERCPEYIDERCAKNDPELQSVADASGTVRPPDTLETSDKKVERSSPERGEHVAACHGLDLSEDERRRNAPLVNDEAATDS